MHKRWLLLITRDMQLCMPPELYWQKARADFEAQRWLWMLFGWTSVPGKHLAAGQIKVGVRHVLHLVQIDTPEPWVAMPLWACLATNEDIYPKMTIDLIAGDRDEGKAWVLRHARKLEAPSNSFGAEWCFDMTFTRKGTKHYAAAHRVKP
jgi:hypothetical protein